MPGGECSSFDLTGTLGALQPKFYSMVKKERSAFDEWFPVHTNTFCKIPAVTSPLLETLAGSCRNCENKINIANSAPRPNTKTAATLTTTE